MKSEFENLIANGVDEVNRRIFFGSYMTNADEITSNDFHYISVEYAIRAIHTMASKSNKPIEIHMNSYGGDPLAMLYLLDVIEACPVQVKFFGGGAIMSAATWIMAVCDERYLYPNTMVMVHKGSYGVDGNMVDNDIKVEFERDLQSRLEDLYAKNSRMPKKFWSDVCKRDLYMSAEEAILLGLADKIVEPKKRGNFRKIRVAALAVEPNANKLNKTVKKMYDRIQSLQGNINITLNRPKQEPIDEKLIIEENVPSEQKPEDKENVNESRISGDSDSSGTNSES